MDVLIIAKIIGYYYLRTMFIAQYFFYLLLLSSLYPLWEYDKRFVNSKMSMCRNILTCTCTTAIFFVSRQPII